MVSFYHSSINVCSSNWNASNHSTSRLNQLYGSTCSMCILLAYWWCRSNRHRQYGKSCWLAWVCTHIIPVLVTHFEAAMTISAEHSYFLWDQGRSKQAFRNAFQLYAASPQCQAVARAVEEIDVTKSSLERDIEMWEKETLRILVQIARDNRLGAWWKDVISWVCSCTLAESFRVPLDHWPRL
jgi:hypothetical protein